MKKMNALIVILLCGSLWQLTSASWIHAKAIIAQQLLNHSWSLTLNDSTNIQYKPWPWADTWPVAKLIAPQQNIEQIILAGDSGNSLAFGPGYSLASNVPNTGGTTIISAHRDTHFSFLQNLKINDTFTLQTVEKTIKYQIYDLQIVDSKKYTIQKNNGNQKLILVTCYPFKTIIAGGSLRYLVFAKPISII